MAAYTSVETLFHWLRQHSDEKPGHPAIECAGASVSYGDLRQRVGRLATGLYDIGVRSGDIVAVLLPNIPEFVVAYLAISSLGAIVQTLHMAYGRDEIEFLLADTNARCVIGVDRFRGKDHAGMLLAIKDQRLPDMQVVILGATPPATAHAYTAVMEDNGAPPRPKPVESDPFLILHTSGTTARPKGVCHRYGPFLGNARRCAEEWTLSAADRLLPVAGMSHLYGLFVCNMSLARGATLVLLPEFSPGRLVATIGSQRPTAVFAGPAHLARIQSDGLLEAGCFSGVRFVCLSGSTVPVALASAVDDMLGSGCVLQLWGMTELQAGAITRPDDPREVRCGSCGRAVPDTMLRVVDSNGRALSAGEDGELEIKGPSVFSAYLDRADETAAAFTVDGWFKTGDLAALDAAGNLIISGRSKDVINRGGMKFNPVEIEAIIESMPAVARCVVIPIPDPELGERACALVVPAATGHVTLDDLLQVLAEHDVAKYKWPERLALIEEVPLTPTQKVMRQRLRNEFLTEHGDD